MAKTDTLNIRIEPELKKEVEKTLNDLGLNIADAVTVFLKQVVMTNSIPFMIKKPTFNKETIEAIKEADAIMEKPENYKSYNSVYDMIEEIDNEDK